MSDPCLCCGGAGPIGLAQRIPLLRFPGVPISGYFLDGADASLPRHDLSLEYCDVCGLVSKLPQPDGVLALDYTTIDRGTAQQMPDYASLILDWMASAGVSKDAVIVEVGSNDASFLDYLAAAGYSRLRGIEPSRSLAASARAKGYAIETGYCTQESAAALIARDGAFAAVVCRHTLEHVPAPSDLIAALGRLLAPGGIAVIEVPDFDWVIEALAVHEIWDEHVTYFARANLALALSRAGFDVLKCERVRFRDTRNLVALARWRGDAQPVTSSIDKSELAATVKGCAGLGPRWNRLCDRLRTDARSWPKPVLAIGASHIQSNFIHFAGLAGHVDGLIDDDPRKAGKFVLLDKGRPVKSTVEAVATGAPGTVLRTAFPYPAWMDKLCDSLSKRGTRIVDPYAGLPHPIARPD